jgi:hypothetical protein
VQGQVLGDARLLSEIEALKADKAALEAELAALKAPLEIE